MNIDITKGSLLPAIKRTITQQKINSYADASGDHNPIHIDETFATATPLGGTIAHGMLVLAYLSELMTKSFGKTWFTTGNLNIRFKAPARPGDELVINGVIDSISEENNSKIVTCNLNCVNQNEETIVTGSATVKINN